MGTPDVGTFAEVGMSDVAGQINLPQMVLAGQTAWQATHQLGL